MNTTDFLAIARAICPERTAIVFEGRSCTFAELDARVNRLAGSLAAAGIGKGDRIGLLQHNTPACAEVYFAVAGLGAVYVPISLRTNADEMTFILKDSAVKHIFVGAPYLTALQGVTAGIADVPRLISLDERLPGLPFYEDMLAGKAADSDTKIDDTDITALVYTLKETGSPKQLALSHKTFETYMLENVTPADPDIAESNMLTIPLYSLAGLQVMLSAVYGGRSLIMQRYFEPVDWLEMVQRNKAVRAMMVPATLQKVMAHPDFCKYDISSLKVITYGAAPLPLDMLREAVRLFPGVSFINALGQEESTFRITALEPADYDLSGTPAEVEAKLKRLTSVGKPLTDVEMKVVDSKGNRLGTGRTGELLARGTRVMNAYWDEMDKSTLQLDSGGWLHTGDMGYVDADGYYYLTGRTKGAIAHACKKALAGVLEGVLRGHPAVADAAVVGVPSDWGEEPLAVVVRKPGADTTAAEIAGYCRERLAGRQRPCAIEFIDELPRDAAGRIRKQVLREKYRKTA